MVSRTARAGHRQSEPPRRRGRVVASLLAAALVVAGAAVAATTILQDRNGAPVASSQSPAASPTPGLAPPATVTPPLWQVVPSPAAAKLSPLTELPSRAPRPSAAAVAGRLAGPLADPALAGATTSVLVTDPLTGAIVLDQRASDAVMPASTAKLAVAVAALDVLGPQHRFTTRVLLQSGSGTPVVVLVGGGDPTLAGPKAVGRADPGYPEPARLADLAAATASALTGRGIGEVAVGYDDSLFTGPPTAPGWKPLYVNEGDVAPVSALEVDEGRPDPNRPPRASDPAAVAAGEFADLLASHGLHVAGSPRHQAASNGQPHGQPLASVSSPPLAAQVQRMLGRSDNDVAEALGRHVAIATGQPATFAGAAAAVRETLRSLGVATTGMAMVDASGLSRQDRLRPRTLTDLVNLVLRGAHPSLSAILPALPVGGFSGTLADRYTAPPAAAAAGIVHAKTGTLEGVVTLAGYLRDASGRVVSFAIAVNGLPAPATRRAEGAVDKVVGALAGCGCS